MLIEYLYFCLHKYFTFFRKALVKLGLNIKSAGAIKDKKKTTKKQQQ